MKHSSHSKMIGILGLNRLITAMKKLKRICVNSRELNRKSMISISHSKTKKGIKILKGSKEEKQNFNKNKINWNIGKIDSINSKPVWKMKGEDSMKSKIDRGVLSINKDRKIIGAIIWSKKTRTYKTAVKGKIINPVNKEKTGSNLLARNGAQK